MGKSLSSTLEDSDDDLVVTKPVTTPGALLSPPKKKSLPTFLKQASLQARPPPSIFKTNPSILTCGYLRNISGDNMDVIPQSVCIKCCDFYSPKYKSLILDSSNSMIINNIDDHCYDNITVHNDVVLKGIAPILKLSSTNHLQMDWNSSIQNTKKQNGTIILTVFGDITMNKNTQLSCVGNGNIYIQCNNLIMRTGAIISTTSMDVGQDTVTPKGTNGGKMDSKIHGNVYMHIRKSLIMDKMSMIKSGNVIIESSQIKIGNKASINALRKDLEIWALNGIVCDWEMNNAFYANKLKKIYNIHTMNDDKLEETMRNNLSHKLTMFEEDSDADFECCICWNREPNYMLKPCGHSTFCETCIKELNPIECPICRMIITDAKKF